MTEHDPGATLRVGVVIPHHRKDAPLAAAVASVGGTPVVVVDDSPDGYLSRELGFHGAAVCAGLGGGGFARAANRGLAWGERQGWTHCLLLNDDARLLPGCLDTLVGAWRPGDGALGPLLLREDGGVESAGVRVTAWGRVRLETRVPRESVPVDALMGACLLVPSRVRFDEDYAHGFEDVALCLNLRRAGSSVRLVPAAQCQHRGGFTIERSSPEASRHAVSGHLRLVEGGWRAPLVVGLSVAHGLRRPGRLSRIRGIAAGVADYWRGLMG